MAVVLNDLLQKPGGRMSGMPDTGSRLPTIDERVAATPDRLTPSMAKVARFFSERREDAAFLSASDIAAMLEVSDATVIRTAQTLGYSGLPELKRELREAMRERSVPAVRYRHSLDQWGTDDRALLDNVLGAQLERLASVRQSLAGQDFRGIVDLLAPARRIVVFGLGPYGMLADHFVLAVRRFGRSALALPSSARSIPDGLMELRSGDVLLLFAYERLVPEVWVALDHAARRDVPSVVFTDRFALALKGRYAAALAMDRGQGDAAPSIAVPLVVVEALVLALMARDRQATQAAFQELSELRERLGTDDEQLTRNVPGIG
jgi:DNA-binding MurR/RpiR family transcriptional regulator